MANVFLTECERAVNQAAGRDLSEDEMEELVTSMRRTVDRIQSENSAMSMQDAALKAADELGNEVRLSKIIEARNRAINLRIRTESINSILKNYSDRPDIGLSALLVGRNEARQGGRNSVELEQNQLASKYFNSFASDLEQSGLTSYFSSKEYGRDIADAIWRIGRNEPVTGLSKEAIGIANIVTKHQDIVRQDANRAGAWIRKVDGYITRQSHDLLKIRGAGYDRWKEVILPKLDASTFDGITDINNFLENVYEGLSTGIHLKNDPNEWLKGFKGGANQAKKISQERVLHFKDGVSWFDYNSEFGIGSVEDAIVTGFERTAASTGLMRKLGTNPRYMFENIRDTVIDHVKLKGDAKATEALRNKMRSVEHEFMEVSGEINIPGNASVARVGAIMRAYQSMVKLGGALISSFNDIIVQSMELRYQGHNLFSATADTAFGRFQGLKTDAKQELLRQIGVYSTAMRDNLIYKYAGDTSLPGRMATLQRQYFKLNGLHWWTESGRQSAALTMSNTLARNLPTKYIDVQPELKRVLSLYNIGDKEWSLMQKAKLQDLDGKTYFSPTDLRYIPDDDFAALVISRGVKVTENSIRDARETLEGNLRGYFLDRTAIAMTETGARTRALMRQGTKAGSVEGEMLRFIGQFKSFSASFLQNTVGRELYGRGYTPAALGESGFKSLGNALRNGQGEWQGMAQLIVWTTVFGYLSLQAKTMLRGQEPRPLSKETVTAAFLQGGGLGILGDFLFGEYNRFGGGALSTLAGPTIGDVAGTVDLWSKMLAGEAKVGDAFRFSLNHTPFLNLYYVRPVMDYLILNRIQETLSPGSLRRHEANVRKEQGNDFFFPPSQFMLGK